MVDLRRVNPSAQGEWKIPWIDKTPQQAYQELNRGINIFKIMFFTFEYPVVPPMIICFGASAVFYKIASLFSQNIDFMHLNSVVNLSYEFFLVFHKMKSETSLKTKILETCHLVFKVALFVLKAKSRGAEEKYIHLALVTKAAWFIFSQIRLWQFNKEHRQTANKIMGIIPVTNSSASRNSLYEGYSALLNEYYEQRGRGQTTENTPVPMAMEENRGSIRTLIIPGTNECILSKQHALDPQNTRLSLLSAPQKAYRKIIEVYFADRNQEQVLTIINLAIGAFIATHLLRFSIKKWPHSIKKEEVPQLFSMIHGAIFYV